METAVQPKETCFHYTHLKKEEMEDPLSAIRYFAGVDHLQNLRRRMWDWLITALSASDSQYDDENERWELLSLYERLQMPLEAAYLVGDRDIQLADCTQT